MPSLSIFILPQNKRKSNTWVAFKEEKSEEQKQYEEQIQKKGEFGELLLHTYLRDYFNTVPLLSKIFLKDTDGFTVHGFDAIHIGRDLIDKSKDSLYLGESKIYFRSSGNSGASGVKDLAKDIIAGFSIIFFIANININNC